MATSPLPSRGSPLLSARKKNHKWLPNHCLLGGQLPLCRNGPGRPGSLASRTLAQPFGQILVWMLTHSHGQIPAWIVANLYRQIPRHPRAKPPGRIGPVMPSSLAGRMPARPYRQILA